MKIKKQTIKLENTPSILDTSSIVGKKESEGPLSSYFDTKIEDIFFGKKTFEKAESKFMKVCVDNLLAKVNLNIENIDFTFAGDLLNQCIASGFCMRDLNSPYFGLYGACSTFVESLILASTFVNANYAKKALALSGSHFCTAERQFRQPLEQGNQKSPTSQSTVTASGAALVVSKDQNLSGPFVTYVTPGKIIDYGVTDVTNMGAAMAPAAFDTIFTHLEDTSRKASYYDAIITGDLGVMGSDILKDLFDKEGISLYNIHTDCGEIIYDNKNQNTVCGGSGCGCIASVFSGYFFKLLKEKKINKILLVATGALMSPISSMQGESIPSIAHAISIENEVI